MSLAQGVGHPWGNSQNCAKYLFWAFSSEFGGFWQARALHSARLVRNFRRLRAGANVLLAHVCASFHRLRIGKPETGSASCNRRSPNNQRWRWRLEVPLTLNSVPLGDLEHRPFHFRTVQRSYRNVRRNGGRTVIAGLGLANFLAGVS